MPDIELNDIERDANRLGDDDFRVLATVRDATKYVTTTEIADSTGLPLSKARYRVKKLSADDSHAPDWMTDEKALVEIIQPDWDGDGKRPPLRVELTGRGEVFVEQVDVDAEADGLSDADADELRDAVEDKIARLERRVDGAYDNIDNIELGKYENVHGYTEDLEGDRLPDRVHDLEKRVDAVESDVSAIVAYLESMNVNLDEWRDE